jgi:hypothetical protein
VAQANPHSTLVILERVHKTDTKDQKKKKERFFSDKDSDGHTSENKIF